MHEQTGHDAMIAQRGYVKPWPLLVRVVLRAAVVAVGTAGVIGLAFGLNWVCAHYPEAAGVTVGVALLLLIGWVWEAESFGDDFFR